MDTYFGLNVLDLWRGVSNVFAKTAENPTLSTVVAILIDGK